MKAIKTLKNLKEMPYPQKKKKNLLKRKGNSITPAKTDAQISQTSSESHKLTIQTYRMKKTELNNEALATSIENNKSIFSS